MSERVEVYMWEKSCGAGEHLRKSCVGDAVMRESGKVVCRRVENVCGVAWELGI